MKTNIYVFYLSILSILNLEAKKKAVIVIHYAFSKNVPKIELNVSYFFK